MDNSKRGRYWSILVFEDNIEKNPRWLQKLLDTHLRFCISPYHDKDKWSYEDIAKHPDRDIVPDTTKKAHYHIIIHCDDNMTFKTMKGLTEELGLPLPMYSVAPKGLYRYLYHGDNPEKWQYDVNDVRHYNGSEPSDYLCEIGKEEKSNMINFLCDEFSKYGFTKYKDMLAYARKLGDPNYSIIVQNNVYIFKQILVDNIETYKELQYQIMCQKSNT